ncbi:MAG: IPTL-CTERM sorting domain-containing protein [Chitinophagales bacterium]
MRHSDIYKRIYPKAGEAAKTDHPKLQEKVENLRGKLGKYAMASAALVAVSGTAEATVQFTPANTVIPLVTGGTISAYGTATIDIDGDGNSDVYFNLGSTAPAGAAIFFSAFPGTYSAPIPAMVGVTAGAGFNQPSVLTNAAPIGAGANWLSGTGNFTLNFNDTTGNWTPTTVSGFLGVRFKSATTGDTHYGWVELSIESDKIRVLGFAYEDVPNRTINSGQRVGIPTLSEWGLITLAIFLLSFGTLYIGRREEILAAQSSSGGQFKMGHLWQKPPFEWAVFWKTLLATAGLAGVAGGLSLFAYGTIAAADLIGTTIAGPLFAYLMHLLWIFERDNKE